MMTNFESISARLANQAHCKCFAMPANPLASLSCGRLSKNSDALARNQSQIRMIFLKNCSLSWSVASPLIHRCFWFIKLDPIWKLFLKSFRSSLESKYPILVRSCTKTNRTIFPRLYSLKVQPDFPLAFLDLSSDKPYLCRGVIFLQAVTFLLRARLLITTCLANASDWAVCLFSTRLTR